MKNTPSKALGASLLATMLIGCGILQAPSADAAQSRTAASKTCSTGKGVLRAGDYWSPNGRTTLHQVYPTRVGMVKGNTLTKWKYELYSIKVSNGARVKYGNNAWLFETPRNKKVNVTITWRADHPFTAGKQWHYASCTIKGVG